MDKDFLIIENHIEPNGNVSTEFKEYDGKILIKHVSGLNCEYFCIKKVDGHEIKFSLFKINGIYYVNINGHHVIDYKRFINIHYLANIGDDVIIRNPYFGEIILKNSDVEIVQKAMTLMVKEMKKSGWTWFNDLMYYVFH